LSRFSRFHAPFGRPGLTFEQAYPHVTSCEIVAEEASHREHRYATSDSAEERIPGAVPCTHPECKYGGFPLGSILARMAKERNARGRDVVKCVGTQRGGICMNMLRYDIRMTFKPPL
jgi:hypothetical protein